VAPSSFHGLVGSPYEVEQVARADVDGLRFLDRGKRMEFECSARKTTDVALHLVFGEFERVGERAQDFFKASWRLREWRGHTPTDPITGQWAGGERRWESQPHNGAVRGNR